MKKRSSSFRIHACGNEIYVHKIPDYFNEEIIHKYKNTQELKLNNKYMLNKIEIKLYAHCKSRE